MGVGESVEAPNAFWTLGPLSQDPTGLAPVLPCAHESQGYTPQLPQSTAVLLYLFLGIASWVGNIRSAVHEEDGM